MSDPLYHLAVLTSADRTIASKLLPLYTAQELRDTLEQRMRTTQTPVLRIPVDHPDRDHMRVNVHQVVTWAIVPEGGITPW